MSWFSNALKNVSQYAERNIFHHNFIKALLHFETRCYQGHSELFNTLLKESGYYASCWWKRSDSSQQL